jgi:prepilin-type processing-associated H-X9-DG protein
MNTFHPRRAATGVDLLAVGSIVMVGLAMLIPALTRAREGQNSAICLANLKQIGYGISMYVADQGGFLPGPVISALQFNAAPVFISADPRGLGYYQHILTSFISPYVGGSTPADLLARCPAADAIPVAPYVGQSWYYRPRPYYVVNSFPSATNGIVKYNTNPTSYFGNTTVGQTNFSASQLPKALARVNNPSREWSVADLWYCEARSGARGTIQPAGTWAYVTSVMSGTGTIFSNGYRVPTYPFHNTTQVFETFSLSTPSMDFSSPRLTTGQTNTVFFDGHVAGVRNWTGSVNPCATTLCN